MDKKINHWKIFIGEAKKHKQLLNNTTFKEKIVLRDIMVKLVYEIKTKQDLYDSDTDHGLNQAKQAIWQKQIDKIYNEMRKFHITGE